jgi:hypothetical protein
MKICFKFPIMILSFVALILFSGCNVDVDELGDALCKDLGYGGLTDSQGEFNPRPWFIYVDIYERDGMYLTMTNLKIECDNEIILDNIDYYDPKYQTPLYNPYGGRPDYDEIIDLDRSCLSSCESRDKWGDCNSWVETCSQGQERLIKQ